VTTNPFATRFIRPGELAYIYPPGQSAAALVEQLRANDWQGQIIGPHGSGKSTLLADLTPALAAAGRSVIYRQVKPQGVEPAKQDYLETLASANERTQFIMDGYEQLSWWSRRRIESICRRRRCGPLITAHRDMGLPTLINLQPSLELVEQVVQRLLASDDRTILREDIVAAWEMSDSNIRETLFKLFDVYQARIFTPNSRPSEITAKESD